MRADVEGWVSWVTKKVSSLEVVCPFDSYFEINLNQSSSSDSCASNGTSSSLGNPSCEGVHERLSAYWFVEAANSLHVPVGVAALQESVEFEAISQEEIASSV